MKSSYKPLGNYIQEVNDRDTDLKVNLLLGVSIQKKFIPSIANIIGTDMSTYKIVKRNQFAYGPVTSRNGDKISIALLEDYDEAIVSQAYTPFKVIDINKLLPEYLMMWFRRPEFDRYARFMSHGSAREIFDWEEMCNTLLPIPSITKQQEIVKEYYIIQNRITLNQQLIQKLEETAQAVYKQWFVDFEFPNEEGKEYKSSGGEMEESDLGMIPNGWRVKQLKSVCSKIGSGSTPNGGKESYKESGISLVRSLNVYDFKFIFDNLAFIDDIQAKSLSNVVLEENDVLLNITGVSVARCSIIPKNVLPARVNQHVSIIRPKAGSNLSYYILCSLCNNDNKSKLLGISQSGSTREAITKVDIENFELIIPEKNIAFLFEERMTTIFNSLETIALQNKYLIDMQNLLLSKLATE
jgi:type I restriction enzyme S subunit